jgi:hypothetical protein
VEPTLDKSPERKSDASPFSGDFASYGLPVSCVAFHAVWTAVKTLKSYAQNANKLSRQSQLIAVDFINFIFNLLLNF